MAGRALALRREARVARGTDRGAQGPAEHAGERSRHAPDTPRAGATRTGRSGHAARGDPTEPRGAAAVAGRGGERARPNPPPPQEPTPFAKAKRSSSARRETGGGVGK